MTAKKVQARTPGEKPPAKQMPPQEDAQTTPEPAPPEENPPAAGDVEFSPEQLAVIDAMLEAKMAKANPPKLPKPAAELPDQKDIDPAKIDRAVMTKDGWVCPLESAADKARRLKNIGAH